jgi:hypothetical protein
VPEHDDSRMTRPRLRTLFVVTLLSSLISVGMPWASVATLGQIRLAITAPVALIAFIVAFATTVLAIVVHRKRGLWVLLAAIPALFWPIAIISMVTACSIYGCD